MAVFRLRVVSPSHRLCLVPFFHPMRMNTFCIHLDIIRWWTRFTATHWMEEGERQGKAQGEMVHWLADEHFESTGQGWAQVAEEVHTIAYCINWSLYTLWEKVSLIAQTILLTVVHRLNAGAPNKLYLTKTFVVETWYYYHLFCYVKCSTSHHESRPHQFLFSLQM